MYRIETATPDRMDEIRCLFREYAASLSVDLCFQNFSTELAGLPGSYDPIVAIRQAACVALRPLTRSIAEMKRLYVRPEHRGKGLGRRLAESIIQAARDRGYRAIRLDSLPEMQDAIDLYRQLGFREISSYCENPVPGAVFMELSI